VEILSNVLTTVTFFSKWTRALTLEKLCAGGARTQLAIARAGGIDLSLGALRLGLQSPDISAEVPSHLVAAEGCLAIWNIAARNATTQRDVVERGGVSLLLRALRHVGGNAMLQRSASGALWNLMCGPQSEAWYGEVKRQVLCIYVYVCVCICISSV
jgi:hypothetical protein